MYSYPQKRFAKVNSKLTRKQVPLNYEVLFLCLTYPQKKCICEMLLPAEKGTKVKPKFIANFLINSNTLYIIR